ncbi:MAG: hypothetical protein DMG08_30215 [Acidobacteria bacterium]|nr:MAG: hypothetical protein DMG08_30215 [Acidobacteriota bacterium]
MPKLFCDELLDVELGDVAEARFTKVRHEVTPDQHTIAVLGRELESRQDEPFPLPLDIVAKPHCRLRSDQALVERSQFFPQQRLCLAARWNFAHQAEHYGALQPSSASIWLNHVFPPASNPDLPASSSFEQGSCLVSSASHFILLSSCDSPCLCLLKSTSDDHASSTSL